MIRVLDLDSRQGGAGDLMFDIVEGDSSAFFLNATPAAEGWWDVAVVTDTVREAFTAMTRKTSTSSLAVL